MSREPDAEVPFRGLCEPGCDYDQTSEPDETDPSPVSDPQIDWPRLLVPCLRRILRWRVPPNWSRNAWEEVVYALAMASGWQALRDFDPKRAVPADAFLYQRVLANAYTRYRQEWAYARRQRHDHDIFLEAELKDQSPPVSTDDAQIESGIQCLCECDRMLLRMIFWDGLSQQTAASQLGVSQQAVSKRLRKALQQLRISIEAPRKGATSSHRQTVSGNQNDRL